MSGMVDTLCGYTHDLNMIERNHQSSQGYQPRTNMVKDDKGDLVADSHSMSARWRNYFSQILKVHGVNDVRQT